MGMFDWLLGKKEEKARKYVITTQSGSTYEVERDANGVWILHRPNRPPERVYQIGSKSEEDISELGKRNVGNVILFYSHKGGRGNTSAISKVEEMAA